MARSNGNGGPMEELESLELEWRDEQLQRVRAVFDSVDTGAADADLRAVVMAQVDERSNDLVTGIGVFRDLLRLEHRPDRFRRLLRIWSGRVGGGVRSGEFAAAGLWMRALTEAPVFPEEFSSVVAGARKELSQPDLFESLVKGLAEADDLYEAAPLLGSWGEPLVEYLVGQMAVEEPVVNRRHLVDYLSLAGRGDIRLLTARLADPRWYIVRNVAIAIGRAGRTTAIPALEAALGHEDDRVRLEVLRSLAALKGDEAVPTVLGMLSDASPKVRQAAASLLRASPSPAVVPGIVDALEQGVGSAEDGRRLVEIVAARRGDDIREALQRLAGKRFALGASKAVKGAAQRALAKREQTP